MADDSAGDKTEAPTPRRIMDARQKGNVGKSPDLNSAVGFLVGFLCLSWFGSGVIRSWMTFLRQSLESRDPAAAGMVDLNVVVRSIGTTTLAAAGPIMLGLVVAGLFSNLIQVGFLLTSHPLTPKLDKLNPINGIKRLFSMRTIVQLGMNLLKLTVVTYMAYRAIQGRLGDILVVIETTGWQQLTLTASVLFDIGLQLSLTLLLIALIDFAWQKYKFKRDLRMSKQEVKEEMRRMEGDPVMKQRRRKAQLAAAFQRIRSAVPRADVVVTNPTELAIAIKYDAERMAAPRVIAKGEGYLAQKIREVAMAHGIPIVERKPLAQALYKLVEVGQEVPEKFYKAIAEILAYVYELSGRAPPRPAPAG